MYLLGLGLHKSLGPRDEKGLAVASNPLTNFTLGT